MESQHDIFSSELKVDATAKAHIRSLASWAMVVVTTTVIGYLLNIAELVTGADSEPEGLQQEGFSAAIFSGEKSVVGTIITVLIGLAINYFLYRFASTVTSAVASASPERLSQSFRNLKTYFAITSVFMMLFLLIMLIAVVALL